MERLEEILRRLLVEGKGILAADESTVTANKRLVSAGVEPTAEMRRLYRQLLFTAPGIEAGLSGVILFDETIKQKADNGDSFVQLLNAKGIVPGIKTDSGLVDLADSVGEQVSQGLEGLEQRNHEYLSLGARFAKWRSVFRIGDGTPSDRAIIANAKVLAAYAKITQASGLVPIVEPEVLIAGTHSLETCEAVLIRTLQVVFAELEKVGVVLRATVLKSSMVLPGRASTQQTSAGEIAKATIRALNKSVPAEVAAVVFLSGGQTPQAATENLNEIAKLGSHPWFVTFSYSRALQDPVLKHWAGKPENVPGAQAIFARRIKLAAMAQQGRYSSELEQGLEV